MIPNTSLLNTTEAARYLGLHQDTMRLWRKQNRGPAFLKVGNRYRYSLAAIEAFLAKEAR